ncbi:hypothetical protein [Kordiimonas aquimaris]|uniref:hypothetical protein n=1 Tax=Kordiimonas aquimaris TaxID=707591 RepID=UPI0021D08770|nr:hypothetical protein [Kordiimonas aquimaris]
MDKTAKVNWRKASVEVASIVFAVLLALWLEGWREDTEQQYLAQENLDRVVTEITQNRADLVASIALHKSYIQALSAALNEEALSFNLLAPHLKVDGGTTSNAAWQSARMSTSVSRISPEVTVELAALYDTQAYYADYLNFFFQRYIDLISDIEESAAPQTATRKFIRHLAVTNALAGQLLGRYDNFLKTQGVSIEGASGGAGSEN